LRNSDRPSPECRLQQRRLLRVQKPSVEDEMADEPPVVEKAACERDGDAGGHGFRCQP
jgi:hypothetical protein